MSAVITAMRTVVEILIVDDSDEDAALTLDVLHSTLPNAAVLRLTDGEQALHFICSSDGYARRAAGLPRLVLLDLHMPGMDGIAVVRSLRARPEMSDLPIVLWSSSANPVFAEQALQAGASAYHVKPSNLDAYRSEMEAILQQWLNKPVSTPAARASQG
jgi:two-component system response regulator